MNKLTLFFSSRRSIWLLLSLHFLVWLLVSLFLDVHPDMADHWVWSRHLYGGYYEHPPMVAFTMRLVTLFGANTILTLKVGAVLFSCLILFCCYLAGEEYFNRRSALIFVLILETAPFFSLGSVYWSIDQPFMLFWLLGMVVIGRYIRSGNLNWFFLFGVIAGLGALSKYTMVLLPLSILIWSILEKRHRKLLYHWKVYASAILAFLILLPNLYWNYQNQWVTFDFLLGKGLTGNSFNFNALLFFAAQLFVFSFVYSCFFWGGLLRKRIRLSTLFPANPEEREKGSFLFICGLFPVLFFTLSSVPGEYTDPSWLDTAYFGIFLLLAKFIDIELSQGKIRKTVTLYLAAFLFNVVLISILLSQIYFNIFNLTERQMTLFSVIGWPETASQIEEIFRQQGVQLPEYVVSREYQVASGLSLYLENHPLPHSLEKPRRNQWSPVNDVLKKGAVLVCPPDDCEGDLEDAKAVFNRSLRLVGESFVNHRKGRIRELRIYYLPGS